MASSLSSTTTANQKKKLAHRSLALTSNHWVENDDVPLFTASFSSIYSVPRRQPPSLNDLTFSESLLEDSIPVFRQPGSTERAMAALSQSRYERMERRRALMLLGVLLILAVATKVSTSQMSDLKAEAASRFRNPGSPNSSPSSGFDNTQDQATISEMALSPETAGPPVTEEDPLFEALQHLAEFSDRVTPNDIPLYWHVPRCAGELIKQALGSCLSLTISSAEGVRDGHQHDETIKVFTYNNVNFVNVDTSSLPGIERARELGLAASGVTPVVFSSYFHAVVSIFDDSHRGRAFTLLRHPVDRAVSMYHYIQKTDPAAANIPLLEYARGQGIENNWMVRYLINQVDGDLDRSALDQAKMVLKRKFLIGLVEEKEESIKRFQTYFGWEYPENDATLAEKQSFCVSSMLTDGINTNTDGYEVPKKGSQEYALISHQNQFDIKLYEYARDTLFVDQTKRYGSKEWKKAEKLKQKPGGK